MSKFEQFKQNPPSIATVRNIIWKSGISRKRSNPIRNDRNLEFSKEQRKSSCSKTIQHVFNKKKIVYIDETGFNKDFIPRYGFAIKNSRCFIPALSKSKNYSCIVAMTTEKVIGIQIIEGSVKGTDFGCFFLNLIRHNFAVERVLNEVIFFMDNARIHKCSDLEEFRSFVNIQFNAPYSPFLNPIEELFSLAKSYFRQINIKNNFSFIRNIVECFKMIGKNQIYSFVIHSYKFIIKCLLLDDV